MKRIILLAAAAIFIIACTGESVRYSPYELQDFDPKVQERIKNAEVSIGMSPQAVRYSWGAPKAVRVKESDEGLYTEEWIYTRARVIATKLIFQEGRLVGIVTGSTVNKNPIDLIRGDQQKEQQKENR